MSVDNFERVSGTCLFVEQLVIFIPGLRLCPKFANGPCTRASEEGAEDLIAEDLLSSPGNECSNETFEHRMRICVTGKATVDLPGSLGPNVTSCNAGSFGSGPI